MKFLFLHAGPGLNSFAERAILGPVIEASGHQVRFWNEPSRLRPNGDPFEPDGAFGHWLASAERALLACAAHEPVCLIAHSFSALAGIELARRHPAHLARLVLITPSADPFAPYRNLLLLAQRSAADEAAELVTRFADHAKRTRALLDDPMRQGFELILDNPPVFARLFTYYWIDQDRFQSAVAAQARPEAQFDADSFLSVLGDFVARWQLLRSRNPVMTPALVLFADRDPASPAAEQIDAVRAEIPDARIETVERCGHYLHLEQPHRFLETTLDWSATVPTPPPPHRHDRASQ